MVHPAAKVFNKRSGLYSVRLDARHGRHESMISKTNENKLFDSSMRTNCRGKGSPRTKETSADANTVQQERSPPKGHE